MKMLTKLCVALFAPSRCSHRARAGAGEARRLVGQGLLQVRGRRALRGDQEVRAEDRRQGRAVAVRGAGRHPEDGRRRSTPARRPTSRTSTSSTSRSPASGRTTASSRTSRDVLDADQGQVPAEHARDDVPAATRRRTSARTTPSRSSSRRCTSSTGRTCWPRPGSRKPTSRRPGRSTGTSGATRRRPTYRKKTRQAHLRHRPAAGRRLERLVLLVPDLHGRLQRQAGRRQRQADWSTTRRCARA